jgi:hypothetical protein
MLHAYSAPITAIQIAQGAADAISASNSSGQPDRRQRGQAIRHALANLAKGMGKHGQPHRCSQTPIVGAESERPPCPSNCSIGWRPHGRGAWSPRPSPYGAIPVEFPDHEIFEDESVAPVFLVIGAFRRKGRVTHLKVEADGDQFSVEEQRIDADDVASVIAGGAPRERRSFPLGEEGGPRGPFQPAFSSSRNCSRRTAISAALRARVSLQLR